MLSIIITWISFNFQTFLETENQYEPVILQTKQNRKKVSNTNMLCIHTHVEFSALKTIVVGFHDKAESVQSLSTFIISDLSMKSTEIITFAVKEVYEKSIFLLKLNIFFILNSIQQF